jgi:hypothetical protein
VTRTTSSDPLGQGAPGTAEALALFDRLQPASAAFVQGAWSGRGFPTVHPLDGLLEACHWHGKRIDGPEAVHPLVFRMPGGRLAAVRPIGALTAIALVQRWPALKSPVVGRLVQGCLPLLATPHPIARLRMMEHRGVTTATIVYDRLPIQDVLRQVDPDTLLGLMDLKGMAQPLFFVLRRERA